MNAKIKALESGIFALLDQWQNEPDIDKYLGDLGELIAMRARLIRPQVCKCKPLAQSGGAYVGILSNRGEIVRDEYALDAAVSAIGSLSEHDKREFVDWFFGGNWTHLTAEELAELEREQDAS